MNIEDQKDKVNEILDGWFGESLENAENAESRRVGLYEPLRRLIHQTMVDQQRDTRTVTRAVAYGVSNRHMKRAAAANKTADQLRAELKAAIARGDRAEMKLMAIAPHLRAILELNV